MELVRVERPGPQLEEAKALLVEYWKRWRSTARWAFAMPRLAFPTPGALCLELTLR